MIQLLGKICEPLTIMEANISSIQAKIFLAKVEKP
jgi:hypothetical protein